MLKLLEGGSWLRLFVFVRLLRLYDGGNDVDLRSLETIRESLVSILSNLESLLIDFVIVQATW